MPECIEARRPVYPGESEVGSMLRSIWTNLTSGKRVIGALAGEDKADLEHLATLMATGHIKAFIDSQYRLDEIVEAHKYVESGGKKGNVVVRVGE